jgi:hypothetical protein
MARQANVDAVVQAIVESYREAGDREPDAKAIAERSGVSPATYYRVLSEHSEAAAALAAAQSAFRAGQGRSEEYDPVVDNPRGVVKELKAVIASLLSVNEAQQQRIEALTRQLQDRQKVVTLPHVKH